MKRINIQRTSLLIILLALAFFSCEIDKNPVKSFEEVVARVPDVELISGAENATVTVNMERQDSYFSVTIDNTSDHNGVYNAWCAQLDVTIQLGKEHAGTKLYAGERDKLFNKLRYVINKRSLYEAELSGLSWRDIQVAFWVLLETENYDMAAIESHIPSNFGSYKPEYVNAILDDVKKNEADIALLTGGSQIIYYQVDNNQNGIIIPPCEPCKGGITQLTLKNLGAPGQITVYNSNDTKGTVLFDGSVATGDEFTIVPPTGDSKLSKDISVYRNGVFVTQIHTSCSKPIGPGVRFVDFEVVEAFSKDGGRVCPVPDCLPCKGGITQLTLKNEGPGGTVIVYNSKDNKGAVLYNQFVATGGEFTFVPPAGKTTLEKDISVYRDGAFVTQIHTSCSKPIGPGVRFVDFEVVEAFSKDGGKVCPVPPPPDCEPCKGGIVQLTLKNEGATGTIVVYNSKDTKGAILFNSQVPAGDEFTFTQPAGDSKMNNDISVYRNGLFVTTIHTSCSQPIGPGSKFVDFVVVQAFSKDNQAEVCPIPPPPDCEPCKGGIVQLTLKNEGAAGTIVVYNSKDTKGAILFNSQVPAGGEFTFTQPAGDSKMNNDISVYRNGVFVTQIHTSCSKPIGPGSIFVDFLVVQAFSKDNQAEVCPV